MAYNSNHKAVLLPFIVEVVANNNMPMPGQCPLLSPTSTTTMNARKGGNPLCSRKPWEWVPPQFPRPLLPTIRKQMPSATSKGMDLVMGDKKGSFGNLYFIHH